jgi:hypothetical protein
MGIEREEWSEAPAFAVESSQNPMECYSFSRLLALPTQSSAMVGRSTTMIFVRRKRPSLCE